MTGLIISLVFIVVCIAIVIWILKTIVSYFKYRVKEMQYLINSEKEAANAILYKYAKKGKIPSWAFDAVQSELKQYCKRAQFLDYDDYISKQELEILKLPEYFHLEESANSKTLVEECVIRFRDFDMDTYMRTGKLSDYDKETYDYLVRMWYFSYLLCNTLDEAAEAVETAFEGYVDTVKSRENK